jgi:hypothetical protein
VPVLLTAFGFAQAPTIDGRARRWIAALNEVGVERAIASVETLPNAYRRHLLSRLTTEQRGRLWRGYVERFRSSRNLTTAQRAYLGDLQALLAEPVLFNRQTRSATLNATIERTFERSKTVFSAKEATELLRAFGPEDSAQSVREPGLNAFIGWVARQLTVSAQSGSGWPCDCDWHVGDDEDGWCQFLHGGPTWRCFAPSSCTPSSDGCGLLGDEPCHHFCQTISPQG